MTKQDKELLIKDLCARLPYGVKISLNDGTENIYNLDGNIEGRITEKLTNTIEDLGLKPYLRPMSSMTDGEKEIYKCFSVAYGDSNDIMIPNPMSIDFLLWKHFDYRGLIEKGLALEAPEGIYKID